VDRNIYDLFVEMIGDLGEDISGSDHADWPLILICDGYIPESTNVHLIDGCGDCI
jgi:hypothetical protein